MCYINCLIFECVHTLCLCVIQGPAILEDVLIEVFRTLHTQCRTELDLQNQSPFSKDHTHLSRSV